MIYFQSIVLLKDYIVVNVKYNGLIKTTEPMV